MGRVGRLITAYAMLRGTATPFSKGAVPPYIPRHNARGSHLSTFSPTLPTLPSALWLRSLWYQSLSPCLPVEGQPVDLCMNRVTFLIAGAKFLRYSREKDEFCLSDRGILPHP